MTVTLAPAERPAPAAVEESSKEVAAEALLASHECGDSTWNPAVFIQGDRVWREPRDRGTRRLLGQARDWLAILQRACISATILGMPVVEFNRRIGSVSERLLPPLAWLCLLLLATGLLHAQRRAVVPMASTPGPNEFDTAAPGGGGQAGGARPRVGLDYSLVDLRCPGAGAAIVGMRLRRGDVLDYVQLVCATPTCANGGCQWTASTWGPAAGNPSGGDPQPLMLCNQNEIVSGFRGRVVTFTVFDYAADIEIQCSTATSAITTGGFRVSNTGGHWHQGQGSLNLSVLPPNFRSATITDRISCRPHGGATAVSVGVADNFVDPGQRVAQAVSFYCPRSLPDPNCPDSLSVAGVDNQSAAVQQQWFAPSAFSAGGRTAGGSVATMRAQPTSRNFNGAVISEAVALDTTVAQCPVPNPAALCTVGTGLTFTVGDPATQKSLGNGLTVPWNPPGGHQNSFADLHFAFDPRATPEDFLARLPRPPAGGCLVTCRQTYSCGAGASAITYGPFQIVYTLVHATWRATLLGIANPLDSGKSVTLVTVDKH